MMRNRWNYLTIVSAVVLVLVSAGWWRTHMELESHLDVERIPQEVQELKQFKQVGARFTACDGLVLCMLAGVEQETCELNLPVCE